MRVPLTQAVIAAAMVWAPLAPALAQPANPMHYTLLTPQQAQGLPSRGGALGMEIGRGQQISSGGLSFQLMRIKGVRVDTPGSQAGFRTGDQIVAVDGHVFPDTSSFAAYIRSQPPGKLISMDYIPAGGGPQQAQRVGVTVGDGSRAVAPAQASGGLSTGEKLAIGAGAVALFGCYEMGCLNRNRTAPAQPR